MQIRVAMVIDAAIMVVYSHWGFFKIIRIMSKSIMVLSQIHKYDMVVYRTISVATKTTSMAGLPLQKFVLQMIKNTNN